MFEPLLSVAVITYNQKKYISQTLDSILQQEHDYLYEIIIGDDCSSDGTREIIEEYVEKYPELIKPIYNNPNKGLIDNYFNVIAHCSGKYIMECAGDDYWLPGKVQFQISYMESHPDVGLCYGKTKIYEEAKQRILRRSVGGKKEKFFELMLGNSIPAVTVCFRRELAEEYYKKIQPAEKNWLMEDIPMWLWFSKNSRVKFLNKNFSVYRILNNSVSHSDSSEKQKKFNNSCYEVRKYFAKMYDSEMILNEYLAHTGFTEAWNNKDFESLEKNYKKLSKTDKTLKNRLKYAMGKFFLCNAK